MEVVDAAGTRLGTVRRVVFADSELTRSDAGDPQAQTAEIVPSPADMTDMGALDMVGPSLWDREAALGDVPDAVRAHLREVGFLEIDSFDLTEAERYVPGDHIDEVAAARVVVRPRA
jgi:hypothetical protein